jgi:hypothetical protein
MATKITEETNQETGKKESRNFMSINFYLKCCCGSLQSPYFVVIYKFVPVPFTL